MLQLKSYKQNTMTCKSTYFEYARQNRLSNDTKEVHDIVKVVDDTIPIHSIRDCVRLGKYTKMKHRPILVKMSRTCEVQTILSNRRKLTSKPSISIKPEMSPEQRSTEKLLQKRWELIQEGVNRANIKLRGKFLYVSNCKHGSIINSIYACVDMSLDGDVLTTPGSDSLDSNTTPSVDHDKINHSLSGEDHNLTDAPSPTSD